MNAFNESAIINNRAQAESKNYPGLIGDGDFSRPELYGFEVGMDGTVIVPELRPAPDCAARLRASMSFTASVRAASEEAA